MSLRIGLNSVWNDNCNLAGITGAGVKMERLEVDWYAVEPEPGQWRWRATDKEFAEAASHGLTVLPLLMGMPGWTGLSADTLPTQTSGFANYVKHVVRRYGPGGAFWRSRPDLPRHAARWYEVWNEPYYPDFSTGGARPAVYARLFRAAVRAGRKANHKAKFLISADTSGENTDGSFSPWVAPMYEAVAHLNRYIGGIAAHPYSAPQPPTLYTPKGNTRYQFRRIEQLRSMFARHGAAKKPFWITEIGWSTCPGSQSRCVSEAAQATYTKQVLDRVRTKYSRWVKALFLYNYRDPPADTNPSDSEHWFGLIRRDGSPKPAWRVLQAATRR
ncbi:MAG TPA: hypothetical protein VH817_09765 [Thermoleophilaceae bacterium]|jgi:hypothetical protein